MRCTEQGTLLQRRYCQAQPAAPHTLPTLPDRTPTTTRTTCATRCYRAPTPRQHEAHDSASALAPQLQRTRAPHTSTSPATLPPGRTPQTSACCAATACRRPLLLPLQAKHNTSATTVNTAGLCTATCSHPAASKPPQPLSSALLGSLNAKCAGWRPTSAERHLPLQAAHKTSFELSHTLHPAATPCGNRRRYSLMFRAAPAPMRLPPASSGASAARRRAARFALTMQCPEAAPAALSTSPFVPVSVDPSSFAGAHMTAQLRWSVSPSSYTVS